MVDHKRRQNKSRLHAVFSARTLDAEKDQDMADFSRSLAYELGPRARVLSPGSMHLTIMNSSLVGTALREAGITNQDLTHLQAKLGSHLEDLVDTRKRIVHVHPDEPFLKESNRKILLNIMKDQSLEDERVATELFWSEEAGVTVPHSDFNPHIALGDFNSNTFPRESRDDLLATADIQSLPPKVVVLNGLSVFWGRIHAQDSYLQNPSIAMH